MNSLLVLLGLVSIAYVSSITVSMSDTTCLDMCNATCWGGELPTNASFTCSIDMVPTSTVVELKDCPNFMCGILTAYSDVEVMTTFTFDFQIVLFSSSTTLTVKTGSTVSGNGWVTGGTVIVEDGAVYDALLRNLDSLTAAGWIATLEQYTGTLDILGGSADKATINHLILGTRLGSSTGVNNISVVIAEIGMTSFAYIYDNLYVWGDSMIAGYTIVYGKLVLGNSSDISGSTAHWTSTTYVAGYDTSVIQVYSHISCSNETDGCYFSSSWSTSIFEIHGTVDVSAKLGTYAAQFYLNGGRYWIANAWTGGAYVTSSSVVTLLTGSSIDGLVTDYGTIDSQSTDPIKITTLDIGGIFTTMSNLTVDNLINAYTGSFDLNGYFLEVTTSYEQTSTLELINTHSIIHAGASAKMSGTWKLSNSVLELWADLNFTSSVSVYTDENSTIANYGKITQTAVSSDVYFYTLVTGSPAGTFVNAGTISWRYNTWMHVDVVTFEQCNSGVLELSASGTSIPKLWLSAKAILRGVLDFQFDSEADYDSTSSSGYSFLTAETDSSDNLPQGKPTYRVTYDGSSYDFLGTLCFTTPSSNSASGYFYKILDQPLLTCEKFSSFDSDTMNQFCYAVDQSGNEPSDSSRLFFSFGVLLISLVALF